MLVLVQSLNELFVQVCQDCEISPIVASVSNCLTCLNGQQALVFFFFSPFFFWGGLYTSPSDDHVPQQDRTNA